MATKKKIHKTMQDVDSKEQGKEMQQKFYKMDFAQLAKNIILDVEEVGGSSILFDSFPKERVMSALQDPEDNVGELRDISNFLYTISPHYKKLCDYHSEMPTLDWYLSPKKLDMENLDVEQFKVAYQETLNSVENMNIKHEMMKILQSVFREGIFFGYEYSTEDSYFFQKLNPEYCRISSIEDGVYNFAFNFEYFDNQEELLVSYAPEFKTKYEAMIAGASSTKKPKEGEPEEDLQWQELDSNFTICIKTDESIQFSFPPFVGVFPEVYELEDYKALKKSNTEMQNYALISGKIPLNAKSDTANDFKVTLDTAVQFGKKIVHELPDQVGFMLSVFDEMQIFRLGDDKVGSNKVEEAVSGFWDASGVGKSLFMDGGTTDAGIKASLTTDEQTVFALLRQIERWVNRKLAINEGSYQFSVTMLNITWQNQKEKVAEELKAGQFGIPNKIRIASSMGLRQSEVSTMAFLENEVLGLHENWLPLQSSHTQNADESKEQEPSNSKPNAPTDGEQGRPSDEEEEVRTDDVEGDE